MTDQRLLARITYDPDIFGGKPIIRGMRISVESILSLLAQGESAEAIIDDHPELEPDDIRACLAYAHVALAVALPNGCGPRGTTVWRLVQSEVRIPAIAFAGPRGGGAQNLGDDRHGFRDARLPRGRLSHWCDPPARRPGQDSDHTHVRRVDAVCG